MGGTIFVCIQTALLTDYDHKFKTVCAVSTAFSFIATVKRWSSHRKYMVLMHLGQSKDSSFEIAPKIRTLNDIKKLCIITCILLCGRVAIPV